MTNDKKSPLSRLFYLFCLSNKELISAPSCYQGLKDLAQKWLDSQNTPEEAKVTQEYLTELEADVLSIDSLIAFAGSEKGEQVFSADIRQNTWFHRHRPLKKMVPNTVFARHAQLVELS